MAWIEVKVPDIGDFENVTVIELMVKVGDTVAVEQSLLTVESDKASMEIPSSHAGVVREMKVQLGDQVNTGTVVLLLEAAGAAAETAAPVASAPVASVSAPPTVPAAPAASAPVAASAAPSASAEVTVVVPDIGDFAEVSVIEVFVKVGDTVKVEQSLVTVESDKASMEIPSSHAGVVTAVQVQLGDKVAMGSALVRLQVSGAAAVAPAAAAAVAEASPAASPAETAPKAAPAPVADAPAPAQLTSAAVAVGTPGAPAYPPLAPNPPAGSLPHASPSIRKLARELGVPLVEVKGSGPKGRITQDDVQTFVKRVMAGELSTAAQAAKAPKASASGAGLSGDHPLANLLAWPKVDFAKFGPFERKPLSRIKKISGANLHRNWVMIPHVTNNDDADITELEAFRVLTNKENEKAGVKVTMLAFLIKACVAALKKFPEFNASLEDDALVYKQYFHIGFAADTPNGLVVPVIRDADKKGILDISRELAELSKKARDGKLTPAEMTGGCFSISSLGGIGGTYFTPIINAPEVAILGVCRSAMQPVWDGKAFVPRLMLPLSLSYDHRVIDGAAAARFNAYLIQVLGDFRRIML